MKLNETSRELKKLQALREQFVKEVGSTFWEEAVAKFPHYTTDDQLTQFLNIPIRNDATPPSFPAPLPEGIEKPHNRHGGKYVYLCSHSKEA